MRTNLREGEEVVLVVRKHWIVLVKPWLIFAGSAVLFLYALFSENRIAREFFTSLFGLLVFCGLYLWYAIIDRKVDLWIVSTRRVIDERGVFKHEMKESPIDKINNIEYSQNPIGRLLGYGSIEIDTAAEAGATSNSYVTNPKALHDAVVAVQEKFSGKPSYRQHDTPRADEVECPFCAERVRRKARICKHCGSELAPQDEAPAGTPDGQSSLNATSKEDGQSNNAGEIDPRDWMKSI